MSDLCLPDNDTLCLSSLALYWLQENKVDVIETRKWSIGGAFDPNNGNPSRFVMTMTRHKEKFSNLSREAKESQGKRTSVRPWWTCNYNGSRAPSIGRRKLPIRVRSNVTNELGSASTVEGEKTHTHKLRQIKATEHRCRCRRWPAMKKASSKHHSQLPANINHRRLCRNTRRRARLKCQPANTTVHARVCEQARKGTNRLWL